jgi:hypothetical protein
MRLVSSEVWPASRSMKDSVKFGFDKGGKEIVKDQIMRPEGGEWELIKILDENLAYAPNQIQHASLLARSRPHSYRRVISLRNWVRN